MHLTMKHIWIWSEKGFQKTFSFANLLLPTPCIFSSGFPMTEIKQGTKDLWLWKQNHSTVVWVLGARCIPSSYLTDFKTYLNLLFGHESPWKLTDPNTNWNVRSGQKKKKLDSMLTSSFQTVIKRYNSNSQEIKIEMLIWHSRAKFILTLIFFAPKIIWDPPGKKEVFMDYHTIEKKRELRFDLVIIPHWGIKSTYKFDTSL